MRQPETPFDLSGSEVRSPLTLGQRRERIVRFYRDGMWDAAEAMNYVADRSLWPVSDPDWEGPWGRFISELNELVEPDDHPPSAAVAAPVTPHQEQYDRRAG